MKRLFVQKYKKTSNPSIRSVNFLLSLRKNSNRMKKIASIFWHILVRFKYPIVIVVGILAICFIDENSAMRLVKYHYQKEDLKEEIAKYNKIYQEDSRALRELQHNPNAIAKIARKRYFMKNDDEDIFVLSDDEQPANNDTEEDETAK